MFVTRRAMLAATAALSGLGLAACATNTVTASQIATDASLIASGLGTVLPTIAALAGVPPATIAQITADITAAQGAAAALGTVTTGQTAPITIVSALVTAVNDAVALSVVPPLSVLIPQPIEMVLVAAKALLPAIEAAAGLTGATTETPAMSAAAARLILAGAAK